MDETKNFSYYLTLLQKTYERLRNGFDTSDIYIATGEDQVNIIKQQIPSLDDDHLIIEPMRRDTAAAIGLAAVTLAKKFPTEVMINVNSDHFIKDEPKYLQAIALVEKLIIEKPKQGVLIGVNPTYPETGYGYIKMGSEIQSLNNFKVFEIEAFKEKPDLATANEYLSQW